MIKEVFETEVNVDFFLLKVESKKINLEQALKEIFNHWKKKFDKKNFFVKVARKSVSRKEREELYQRDYQDFFKNFVKPKIQKYS